MTPRPHRLRLAAAGTALAVPTALLLPAAAHADVALVSCTGTTPVTYSPGITPTPAPRGSVRCACGGTRR